MKQPKKTRYYLFRIILLTILLYFFLVSPISTILMLKNSPLIVENLGIDSTALAQAKRDSVDLLKNKLHSHFGHDSSDSLIANNDDIESDVGFRIQMNDENIEINLTPDSDNAQMNDATSPLFVLIALLGIIVTLILNIPFKRYFRKKRKGKLIKPKLEAYCRKYLIKMPIINSGILTIIFLIKHITDFIAHKKSGAIEILQKDLVFDFFYISIISSILVILFCYFWQKNRLHQRYLDVVFNKDELKKSIFKYKNGKIKHKLWLVQGMTTLLPLIVVFFYIFTSTTRVESLGIDELNYDQAKILFGSYLNFAPLYIPDFDYNFLQSVYYVNAMDTILTMVGIIIGIIVSLIYILFFVSWTNKNITISINDVLHNMKLAADKKIYNYSLVRTNDEMGKLVEGYNEMTYKIHKYIDEIEEINEGLEQKVKERTAEIEAQRDEIEAQRDEIAAQRDTATQQRDLIIDQNKEITDSINYAKRIQNAILPSEDILKKNLQEYFIMFKPRDIVSGDFYWFAEIENTLIIACADCTGHGVPGAFMSMLGSAFLKEIVIKEYVTHPGVILNKLRKEIIRSLQQQGQSGEQKDGMDISICAIDLKTKNCQFAGANNPIYLIRNGELEQIKGDKMPVAIYEKMDRFSCREIPLMQNDQLYMFTDGFADQFGGPKGKKFMYKPFKKLILSMHERSLNEQCSELNETFAEWKRDFDQVDDVLIIGIKI